MEEAQFSEDLFSTQDEATFGNANSEPQEVLSHKLPAESLSVNKTPSVAESAENALTEKETPDLVFSEDIDFGKVSGEEENNSSNNAGVAVEEFEEPIEPDVIADERIDTEDVIESSVPKQQADTSSTKESPEERLAQFPFARIKQMMKLDPEVGIVSAEAIFLVTKAAELFLQTLAKDTSSHTLASKKKTMNKRDVELAIDSVASLMFLEGMMNL
uniref:Transcription factor CBF/NF-Y/archaeal histone domain-containing protein n=1 Tax=Anopheles christyi TaxID=43041 RepID=A0A182JPH5_9DIPT